MKLQANPAQKRTAMKPICLRTVLMFFILITVATPFEFPPRDVTVVSKAGNNVIPCDTGKAWDAPDTGQSGQTRLPSGTYDRFDPYTLQGKTISTGVLVL